MCGKSPPQPWKWSNAMRETGPDRESARHRPGDLRHQGGRLRRGRRDRDLGRGPGDAAGRPGGRCRAGPRAVVGIGLRRGREAIANAGAGVTALGFANQGETVLAWDRDTGRPLSTAVSWQDRRAAAICADMAGEADDLTRTTGLPLDPYFAGPKMTWLRRNVTTEGVVTTSDAWLLHRLTGAYVTDVTTASRTLLLDLATRTWSEGACAAFGLDAKDLPEVVGQCTGDRPHRRLRPVAAAERTERRPTGRPGRGALPGTGRVEVHLRHRRLPPGQCRAAALRVVGRLGRLGGLAARRRGRVLHRRPGLCRRRRHRLAAALGIPAPGGGPRRRRQLGRRQRRRHRRARTQWPGCPVVATRRPRQHRGDRPGHRSPPTSSAPPWRAWRPRSRSWPAPRRSISGVRSRSCGSTAV